MQMTTMNVNIMLTIIMYSVWWLWFMMSQPSLVGGPPWGWGLVKDCEKEVFLNYGVSGFSCLDPLMVV